MAKTGKKHWSAISSSYRLSPSFKKYQNAWEDLYSDIKIRLFDYAWASTEILLESFNIKTPVLFSSHVNVETKKDDLIVDLCKSVSATRYISGPSGKSYLDVTLFEKAGIALEFDEYTHPTYPQGGNEFLPYLSAIDLLFNVGAEGRAVISQPTENSPRVL